MITHVMEDNIPGVVTLVGEYSTSNGVDRELCVIRLLAQVQFIASEIVDLVLHSHVAVATGLRTGVKEK